VVCGELEAKATAIHFKKASQDPNLDYSTEPALRGNGDGDDDDDDDDGDQQAPQRCRKLTSLSSRTRNQVTRSVPPE
jgi:hypothetical protein